MKCILTVTYHSSKTLPLCCLTAHFLTRFLASSKNHQNLRTPVLVTFSTWTHKNNEHNIASKKHHINSWDFTCSSIYFTHTCWCTHIHTHNRTYTNICTHMHTHTHTHINTGYIHTKAHRQKLSNTQEKLIKSKTWTPTITSSSEI